MTGQDPPEAPSSSDSSSPRTSIDSVGDRATERAASRTYGTSRRKARTTASFSTDASSRTPHTSSGDVAAAAGSSTSTSASMSDPSTLQAATIMSTSPADSSGNGNGDGDGDGLASSDQQAKKSQKVKEPAAPAATVSESDAAQVSSTDKQSVTPRDSSRPASRAASPEGDVEGQIEQSETFDPTSANQPEDPVAPAIPFLSMQKSGEADVGSANSPISLPAPSSAVASSEPPTSSSLAQTSTALPPPKSISSSSNATSQQPPSVKESGLDVVVVPDVNETQARASTEPAVDQTDSTPPAAMKAPRAKRQSAVRAKEKVTDIITGGRAAKEPYDASPSKPISAGRSPEHTPAKRKRGGRVESEPVKVELFGTQDTVTAPADSRAARSTSPRGLPSVEVVIAADAKPVGWTLFDPAQKRKDVKAARRSQTAKAREASLAKRRKNKKRDRREKVKKTNAKAGPSTDTLAGDSSEPGELQQEDEPSTQPSAQDVFHEETLEDDDAQPAVPVVEAPSNAVDESGEGTQVTTSKGDEDGRLDAVPQEEIIEPEAAPASDPPADLELPADDFVASVDDVSVSFKSALLEKSTPSSPSALPTPASPLPSPLLSSFFLPSPSPPPSPVAPRSQSASETQAEDSDQTSHAVPISSAAFPVTEIIEDDGDGDGESVGEAGDTGRVATVSTAPSYSERIAPSPSVAPSHPPPLSSAALPSPTSPRPRAIDETKSAAPTSKGPKTTSPSASAASVDIVTGDVAVEARGKIASNLVPTASSSAVPAAPVPVKETITADVTIEKRAPSTAAAAPSEAPPVRSPAPSSAAKATTPNDNTLAVAGNNNSPRSVMAPPSAAATAIPPQAPSSLSQPRNTFLTVATVELSPPDAALLSQYTYVPMTDELLHTPTARKRAARRSNAGSGSDDDAVEARPNLRAKSARPKKRRRVQSDTIDSMPPVKSTPVKQKRIGRPRKAAARPSELSKADTTDASPGRVGTRAKRKTSVQASQTVARYYRELGQSAESQRQQRGQEWPEEEEHNPRVLFDDEAVESERESFREEQTPKGVERGGREPSVEFWWESQQIDRTMAICRRLNGDPVEKPTEDPAPTQRDFDDEDFDLEFDDDVFDQVDWRTESPPLDPLTLPPPKQARTVAPAVSSDRSPPPASPRDRPNTLRATSSQHTPLQRPPFTRATSRAPSPTPSVATGEARIVDKILSDAQQLRESYEQASATFERGQRAYDRLVVDLAHIGHEVPSPAASLDECARRLVQAARWANVFVSQLESVLLYVSERPLEEPSQSQRIRPRSLQR